MVTLKDIYDCSQLSIIPRSVHINKGVEIDYRLFQTITETGEGRSRDYKYDFDVFLPKYGFNLQRDYVWEHCQQQEFIMSLLLEKPIDPIIIVEHITDRDHTDVIMSVIDGKQRLLTIKKFANNEFSINIGGKDVYFNDFDDEAKRFFKSRVNYLTGTIYYSYPDEPITDDMKIALFNFYNFAGTPQAEEHKNKLQNILNNL